MNEQLRQVLVDHCGLPADANEQAAQEFYAALPLEAKGRLGVYLAGGDTEHARSEPLTVREEATRDTRELTARTFTLRAESLDEKTRSVEAVLATDDPVAVWDWRAGELIDEVLRIDGADVPAQVPMLDSHSRYSAHSVYGSVRQIQTAEHELTGRLHFVDGDPDVERAYQRVAQGHLRDVSAGYRVLEATDISPGESATVGGRKYTAGKLALRISTRWALKEVSLVPIGADSRSKIRQDPPSTTKETKPMDPKLRQYLESIGLKADATDDEARAFHDGLKGQERAEADRIAKGGSTGDNVRTDPPADPPADPPSDPGRSNPPADPPVDAAEVARLAVAAERDRIRQLRELAGSDVPEAIRERAVSEGWTIEKAKGEFLAAVRESRQPGDAVPGGPAIHSRSREADTHVRSLAAGTLIGQGLDPTQCSLYRGRGLPGPDDRFSEQDADQGHRFRALSAVDLFRECVRLDTGRFHLSIEDAFDAARAAPSGAALSYVFSTNVYARLLEGWTTAGDSTVGWVDEEDVPNFMEQEDISLAANARLEKLPRGDTAKHATASDSHETYKIGRYAKQFVVDEQDVIDDRLGAIMRMPVEMGEGARNLRPDLLYSLMLENPTMTDTGAVFNNTAVTTAGGHANLGTAALDSSALKAAITAMVSQRLNRTASDPGRQLLIRPKFLIVPADLEWTARELTASAALAKLFADSADPWYTQLNLLAKEGLRVVPDDRIGAIGVLDPRTGVARTGSATNWFLAAGGRRGLRVAYRRGTGRQPTMRQFVLDKGQWGLGWDINLDIGGVFTEYRTWYKSTGAA